MIAETIGNTSEQLAGPLPTDLSGEAAADAVCAQEVHGANGHDGPAASAGDVAVDLRRYLEAVIAAAIEPYREEVERLQTISSCKAELIGTLKAQLGTLEERNRVSQEDLARLQSSADDSQRHRLELERLRGELATARYRLLAAEHRVQDLRRDQAQPRPAETQPSRLGRLFGGKK